MKTTILILIVVFIAFAGTKQISSDINDVFLYNHKSFGEFIKMYGSPTEREVRITKNTDVLTNERYEVANVVYSYKEFTYSNKGKIIILLDVVEDSTLGDHQIKDIVIYIDGVPHRHHYR